MRAKGKRMFASSTRKSFSRYLYGCWGALLKIFYGIFAAVELRGISKKGRNIPYYSYIFMYSNENVGISIKWRRRLQLWNCIFRTSELLHAMFSAKAQLLGNEFVMLAPPHQQLMYETNSSKVYSKYNNGL